MRKLFIVLGIIAAILAVVFSVLPVSILAFIPGVVALVFGLLAFFISQKQNQSKKGAQLIFILTIVSLSLTTYKAVFSKTTVGNTEALEVRENESEENAIEELESLDLELEEIDSETIEFEDADLEGLEE